MSKMVKYPAVYFSVDKTKAHADLSVLIKTKQSPYRS